MSDSLEEFVCPLPRLPSMETWIKGGGETECRPCLLAPITSYYVSTLREAGKDKMAEDLTQAFESSEPLTICKKLDSIKNSVGEPIKNKLEKYDCLCQTFKDDEAN